MASEVNLITVVVGIILALITTFCFNLAIVFQKKGLSEGMRLGYEVNFEKGLKNILQSFKGLLRIRSWLFGTILGIIGWFPYIISIGMIGIIITEPVMATGFIVFVVAANLLLNEKVGILEYIAIAMLTFSPVLIGFSGISDPAFDLVEFAPKLLLFLTLTVSLSIFLLLFSKKINNENIKALMVMFGGAILFALGGVFTNILAQAFIQANIQITWYSLFEISFAIIWFFMFSSLTHLWVFLGLWGMIIFNVSSIPFYQGGFQKGKALIMYPILDSIALLLPILAGIFVFNQIFLKPVFFFIALLFIIIGTAILSKYQVAIEQLYAPSGINIDENELTKG